MRRALRGTAAAIMNLRRALKKSTQLTSNARRTSVSDATASDGGAGGGAGRFFPPDLEAAVEACSDARLIPAAMKAAHACHCAGFCVGRMDRNERQMRFERTRGAGRVPPRRPDTPRHLASWQASDRNEKNREGGDELLRDARARTIESSGTTTCLPTISGAASIRMSLAALTSSASYPSLDAHASSKASARNTVRSGNASAGLPAVPATGAGCGNGRAATAAGISRVSRGSIRLRELHANPLDATRPPARARDSARDPVAGSVRAGIQKKARNGSLAWKSSAKDGEANWTPSFPRCSRCERAMQVTMRLRPRCDPRRISCLLARSHTVHAHSR